MIPNKEPLYLKELEKETEPKIRRKEMIKISTVLNRYQKYIKHINQTKSWFFEKDRQN